jgi:hypothetical protein
MFDYTRPIGTEKADDIPFQNKCGINGANKDTDCIWGYAQNIYLIYEREEWPSPRQDYLYSANFEISLKDNTIEKQFSNNYLPDNKKNSYAHINYDNNYEIQLLEEYLQSSQFDENVYYTYGMLIARGYAWVGRKYEPCYNGQFSDRSLKYMSM